VGAGVGAELACAGTEQREAQPALLDEAVDLVEQPGQALQEEARLRQAVQAGNGLQWHIAVIIRRKMTVLYTSRVSRCGRRLPIR
jgi:ornithine cyclodeaminase/alanine dehydrogenase-like protein (mu-crystallin family)